MTKAKEQLKVVQEDVITVKGGTFFLGKEKMTQQERDMLRQEALYFKGTKLWNILTNTLKEQAKLVMFEKAKDWNDMVNGKNMLYTIGVQENIVEQLSKGLGPLVTTIKIEEKS